MYEYTFTNGNVRIDTSSFCNSFTEVKEEIISQTADCTIMRHTYPNGFVVETEAYAGKLIWRTNRELRDNGDGNFTVLDK